MHLLGTDSNCSIFHRFKKVLPYFLEDEDDPQGRSTDFNITEKKEKKDQEYTGLQKSNTNISIAWNYFETVSNTRRRCKLFPSNAKLLKYCGGTTTFLTHLKSKHEEEYLKYITQLSRHNGCMKKSFSKKNSVKPCVLAAEYCSFW